MTNDLKNTARMMAAVLLGCFAALCALVVLFEDSSAGVVLLLIASVAGTYWLWKKN